MLVIRLGRRMCVMRNHVFAFALTCGAAFVSAPAAAQMISGEVGFQSPGFYPQPYYAPPVAASCGCATVRRGFFTSWNFGCPGAAPYPQVAYPQVPAYQPYPAMGYPQEPMYPVQPDPAMYASPAYAPGIGVGVGVGPVGVGIRTNIRHRQVTQRRVCWRDNRGRRQCR